MAEAYSTSFTAPWDEAAPKPTGKSSGNPFETVWNTKIPEADDRLATLWKELDDLAASTTGGAGSYASKLQKNTPLVQAYTDEDIGAVNRVFSGRTEQELAQLRANRRAATALAMERAKRDLNRSLQLTQLGVGGGGRSLGTGSYINRLALDKLGDLEAKAAMTDADQERADYDLLNRMRLDLAGTRQGYLDRVAGRELLPSSAYTTRFQSIAALLNQLLQGQLANRFVGVAKPYGLT